MHIRVVLCWYGYLDTRMNDGVVQRIGEGVYEGAVVLLMIYEVYEIVCDIKHCTWTTRRKRKLQQRLLTVTDFAMDSWNMPFICNTSESIW